MSVNDGGAITGTSPESEPVFGFGVEGAGFWIRVLARGIDLAVHYVVSFTVAMVIVLIATVAVMIMGRSPDLIVQKVEEQAFIGYVAAILGALAYHIFCEGVHGATLGKLICGLIVVKEDGAYCGLGSAIKRSLAFYIDGLFFGVPAAVSMSDTKQKQRIGDRWAKTMVVKKRDLDGLLQARSVFRFIFVFLGGVLLDGAIVGAAQIFQLVR